MILSPDTAYRNVSATFSSRAAVMRGGVETKGTETTVGPVICRRIDVTEAARHRADGRAIEASFKLITGDMSVTIDEGMDCVFSGKRYKVQQVNRYRVTQQIKVTRYRERA